MEDTRNLLISYAYNILGSYEDAKDIVQDAHLKTLDTTFDTIENKKAYLIRTVINLSINRKKRQKKLVNQYPGEWLPEPVATEKADSEINTEEILSYSLMVLLEKLSTKQRAVFILKEAFDYDHKKIAEVLDTSVENSRKIFSRAKQQLQEPATAISAAIPDGYLEKYIEAISNADTKQLECLLKNDVIAISDGGGKASAASRPVYGKLHVLKFMTGVYRKFYSGKDIRIEKSNVNHRPALLYYTDNKLSNCMIFDFEDGHVSRIYIIRNPDKLQSLEKKT